MFYLGHEALVLTKPGLSHGGLAIEAGGQLLQLLLADQFGAQGQLTLMLGLLQPLPGLRGGDRISAKAPGSGGEHGEGSLGLGAHDVSQGSSI